MTTSVFHYQSYRDFLKDYVHSKQQNKKLSYRYFSQRCGFKRPNYFQAILSGERRLTSTSALAVAKGLNLRPLEQNYFQHLVLQEELTDLQHLEANQERLNRLRRLGTSDHIQNMDNFELYLLPIVWEVFQLSGTTYWQPEDIRKALLIQSMSDSDLTRSLEQLQAQGLISRDDAGFFKIKDAVLVTPQNVFHEGMRNCHRHALAHVSKMVDLSPEQRYLQNLVVALDRKQLPALKAKIDEFLNQLNHETSGSPATDQVVQIHVSIAPLTR